jgi:hypothetical protein
MEIYMLLVNFIEVDMVNSDWLEIQPIAKQPIYNNQSIVHSILKFVAKPFFSKEIYLLTSSMSEKISSDRKRKEHDQEEEQVKKKTKNKDMKKKIPRKTKPATSKELDSIKREIQVSLETSGNTSYYRCWNVTTPQNWDGKHSEIYFQDKSLIVYHGAPEENIKGIRETGFDISKLWSNMKKHQDYYGPGFYFTRKPVIAMNYSRGSEVVKYILRCGIFQD